MQVGPKPVWKDPQNPLRQHPALQLKGIPTMMRWQDGAPGSQLGSTLEAAATPEEADRLIKDFVSSDLRSAAAQDGGEVDVQALIQELEQASVANSAPAH